MKTSETLAKAHDILEHDGWCQDFMHKDGMHCAVGAIANAVYPGFHHSFISYTHSVVDAVHQYVMDLGFRSVFDFNDAPSTTKQDVLDLFQKVIASAEERGE